MPYMQNWWHILKARLHVLGCREFRSRNLLDRWSVWVAFCFCIATFTPPHMMAMTFSILLIISGVVSAFVAGARREHHHATRLTGWDVALPLLALGVAVQILSPDGSSGSAVELVADLDGWQIAGIP